LSFADFEPFGISRKTYDLSEQALTTVAPAFATLSAIRETNQLRVIAALQQARLSESTLGGTTGYGYDDASRDQIEKAYAVVFGAEAALVRIQISAGTQALALCLYGLLRPGDELLSVSGPPYDTLRQTIGGTAGSAGADRGEADVDIGSLHDFGITYRQIDLTAEGDPDLPAIASALTAHTKMVYIQKSRGYTQRRALRAADLAAICQAVRSAGSPAIILVDNCYGEFVETREPCMLGADLVAGSLIKNPGGGICPSGGYVAGRADLVAKVAARLTAPGLGSHVGPTLGFSRLIAQGLYLAPHVVCESLKGAAFAAAFFRAAGCKAAPGPFEARGDIVQTLEFGDSSKLIAFCQSIQAASPVDSYVRPEPWAMPGYDAPVIMAAGTFVQGSSIELAADAPVKPPYTAYMQGGLCFENIRLACMLALEKMGDGAR
jgi:cystathionine beta-lyase family protein involved in aluminum resistance